MRVFVIACCFAMALFLDFASPTLAKDELARSTWDILAHDDIRSQVETWMAETGIEEKIADQVRSKWREPVDETLRLTTLADCLALANADARELVEFCRSIRLDPELPVFEFLSSSQIAPFERNNLRLLYARWLAQNELYDETLEQIADLKPEDVVDPASLLFYQSIAYHRLLKKKECLPVVDRLLEREEQLPKRFSALAKLVRADIEPLEEDSLDEISRLMDSIKVRLGHGRAGKRVRTEEDDVIAKLDKMIKELEDQAKQAQSSASSSGKSGENLNPSKPMQDSMPGGGRGPGNIDSKDIAQKDGWGDLPPKERQHALQQLGKEFPSHYRLVIEEYFRKLAREGADP
jgi:hypothetical protein